MFSKNTIKHISSLTVKKYRTQHGEFIAEGPKIVSELTQSDLLITEIYALPDWLKNNPSIQNKSISINSISDLQLKKISSLSTPNQVLAVVKIPERNFDTTYVRNSMVLVLDEIKDPGNLGTIIRIADWFGINHILCSENSVDTFNPKTVQASMGSICRVNVYYEDIADLISRMTINIPVYGAFIEGNSIYSETFKESGFMVIGNESKGISPEIETLITNKISIPTGNISTYQAESLNASIATAIICAEINRQKGINKAFKR